MFHNDHLESSEDKLLERHYDSEQRKNFSICIIDSICEVLGIDPMTTPLYLGKHIDIDSLNERYRFHADEDVCICTAFQLKDYTFLICVCGFMSIHADRVAHQRGELELPASMQREIEDEDCEMRLVDDEREVENPIS